MISRVGGALQSLDLAFLTYLSTHTENVSLSDVVGKGKLLLTPILSKMLVSYTEQVEPITCGSIVGCAAEPT